MPKTKIEKKPDNAGKGIPAKKPIQYSESSRKNQSDNVVFKDIPLGGIPLKDLLYFTNNLSILIKAGSTISESLKILGEQLRGKLKIIIENVSKKVDGGQQLSIALGTYSKYFSEIYINMIKIGEESGRLEENLGHLARQLEKDYDLKKKVLGAMLYPAIIFTGGLGVAIGIAFFVLPKVTKLFVNFKVKLPISTRILIAISNFFQNHGILAVSLLVGTIVVIVILAKRKFIKPVTHWLILKLPVVKTMSRHSNLTTICRTLSTLLNSGVTIDESLEICAKTTSNYHYKKFLRFALERINSGDTLTNALRRRKDLFPLTDIQIIHVGEESGSLITSLDYCAEIHEKEVDNMTRNLSTILEPILLVTIGLMVGFIAISIISPIYSVTENFRT